MDNKPYSQACENNKSFILAHLKEAFSSATHVLEIGSGTGQHAVYFAPALPHLIWQTSDQAPYHAGINQWIDDFPSDNLRRPLLFKVAENVTLFDDFDAIFTANTAHIMQKEDVEIMMGLIANHLPKGGVFCQYGPFTDRGVFTSESNQQFHLHLLEQGYGGYRDINELIEWSQGLKLAQNICMPANNQLLIWRK
ncbi:DUF938 domain-containing protein [Alteromonas sediminis]|uniref:DUF938 domain-containing protein n=1 Tax=Alteromonas sediminis TaxID=2259342 RepID=UPI00362362F5